MKLTDNIIVYVDMDDAFDEQTVKELRVLYAMEESLVKLKVESEELSDVLHELLNDVRSAIDTMLEQETEDNYQVDMDCYDQIKAHIGAPDEYFTMEDYLLNREKYMEKCTLIFA